MRIFLLIGVMTWHLGILNVMADSKLKEEERKSINDFSNLHVKYITERSTGNVACSPLGAFISLSMAAYAARGQIQDQLRSMIDLPTDDKLAKARINSLIEKFKSRKSMFRWAPHMLISKNLNPSAAFDRASKEIFSHEPRKIDLNDSVLVDAAVGRWYRTVTNSFKAYPAASIMVESRIGVVLVNVAWIEGEWLHKFNDKRTKSSTFHLNSHSDKEVPTMFQTNKFKFGEIPDVNATFLELPYKVKKGGNAASMVILLPNEIDGLADMERNLDKVDFDELLRAKPRKVKVGLPYFSLIHTQHGRKTYEKTMLRDMLTPGPKFDATTDEIHVKGVQTTLFEVDEDGSAAEASARSNHDLRSTEDRFVVDRPFIAMVLESGVKLIYARIMNPLGEKNNG